jgi:hypothetical protein
MYQKKVLQATAHAYTFNGFYFMYQLLRIQSSLEKKGVSG